MSEAPRRPILRLLRRALGNWRERHQLPFNFWIHMIGIPLAVGGVALLFFHPWWGVGCIAAGYLLQYLGHRAEGNEVGELIPFKRLLGLPCVSISPRWGRSVSDGETAASDNAERPG